uniref:Homeobox domain-containing protein n=1 Tax=Oryctolagus cuniculus TaxID=9986 RepID=A0A5F9DDG8_RABIT
MLLLLLTPLFLLAQPRGCLEAEMRTYSQRTVSNACTLVMCGPVEDSLPGRDGQDGREGPQGDGHDNIETQHGRRKGKARHQFTPEELHILNQSFAESPYPDFTTKEELVKKLHCSFYTIENWFQNKRARLAAKKRRKVLEARMPYALPVQGPPGVRLQNSQERFPNTTQVAVLGGAVYATPRAQVWSPNFAQAAVLGGAVYTAPCAHVWSPNTAQVAVLGGAVYTTPRAQEWSPNAGQVAVLDGAVYPTPHAQEWSPNAAQVAVLGGAVYTVPCAQEWSPNAAQAAVLGRAVYSTPRAQDWSPNAAQAALLGGAVCSTPPTWEVSSPLYGSWDSGVRGAQEAPSYALENQGNVGGGSFPRGIPGARFIHSFSYAPYFGSSRSEMRVMQPDWPSLLPGVPSAQGAMQQLQEQSSFRYPPCEEWQQNGWGTHPQQPQQPPDYWQELSSQDQFPMQQNHNSAENRVPFPLSQQQPGDRQGDGELMFLQVLSTALRVLSSPTEPHEQDTQQGGARDAQF